MSESTRVLYRDVKPYAIPARLEDLRGPDDGLLELPVNVYWGPNPIVDLTTDDGIFKAYETVIQEGRASDQERLLNRALLIRVWPELMIPDRARRTWEARFPTLAGA
jgi:hypothetical protein